ncbi:hypothetical protein CJU94_26670 [Paraburkholderia aromaticivorans]|uniref:Uncharacterized protein n=1 Tax=Paraburkholderia aromaticivorans TaxID=2026199 RepID=A0A248VRT0_9BURK|nr:hypothetical protein CJU94_26670 [Paraburkholderia aromaticivorans]
MRIARASSLPASSPAQRDASSARAGNASAAGGNGFRNGDVSDLQEPFARSTVDTLRSTSASRSVNATCV